MRITFLISFLILSHFSFGQTPIIKATSSKVDIKNDGHLSKGSWTLMPDLKPDIYQTNVNGKSKKVIFYTDIDSISFIVKPKKTYDFIILLNEKDTCWTQINTIPKFEFSKQYIKKNKGEFSFEVPEVQELVHIIVALTPTGIKDKNMVNHDTKYYEKILKEFGQYKDEPIVNKIDSLLKKQYYAVLKMDACGFYFNGDSIKKDSTYNNLSWGNTNFIESYTSQIEQFAKKTSFRKFYKKQSTYYNRLISLMNNQTPIHKQWDWLENQFSLRYDNYRITFSPLVNGWHSTNRFIQEDFKQTVMFICGPIENNEYSTKINEGLMTRIVFTEIDHNYVNPISDKYNKEINIAFDDLSKWATKKALNNYRNAYDVFNEYMTWSVFSIYAFENFNPEDFKMINDKVELQISDWRGFKNFKAFNQKMIELYNNKMENEKIEDLYPVILEWCKKQ